MCERGARQELGVVIADNTDKISVLSVIQTMRAYLVVQRTRVAKLCQRASDRTCRLIMIGIRDGRGMYWGRSSESSCAE